MKIIVAHPGRQHSFRLASALKKNGMLDRYVTTIYDKENSFLMKILKRFLSADNRKRANGRKNKDLNDNEVVLYCRFGGLVEALLSKIDKTKYFYRWMQRFNANRFGKKVAKLAIKRKADAVITYDSNALECFKLLEKKAPQIKRIMDVSIAARPYMKWIYQTEIDTTGRSDLKKENEYLWDPKKLRCFYNEIAYTQDFLVASQFVKKSLLYCGVREEQIHILPYGANVSNTVFNQKKDEKLHVLFVGQVNYRKGMPYLLEAISQLSEQEVDLTVVGAYNKKDWFIKKYIDKDNIHFVGQVTFDRMKEIYQNVDIFVIDSFAEGMAQVGIEAMACGLPIICSFNSGVSDLVTEGENGFVIPCGDVEALKEKIQWFIDHPEKINTMGNSAREIGKRYTWAYYEQNAIIALNGILAKK